LAAAQAGRAEPTLWWISSCTLEMFLPSPSTAHICTDQSQLLPHLTPAPTAETYNPTRACDRRTPPHMARSEACDSGIGSRRRTSPTSIAWSAHTSRRVARQPASSSEHARTTCRRASCGQLSCVVAKCVGEVHAAATPSAPFLDASDALRHRSRQPQPGLASAQRGEWREQSNCACDARTNALARSIEAPAFAYPGGSATSAAGMAENVPYATGNALVPCLRAALRT
jgi:hypothetical protein